jgi:dTDP-4-dehydrorhamnose 3,5-epimerase
VQIGETGLAGVLELTPRRFGDDRGYFVETYNELTLANSTVASHFVQDNESKSADVGTVRGIHYQLAPDGQGKLVRVAYGRVLDVAVDLRVGSASFGQHVAVELSSDTGNQLWLPEGFGHGFVTLEPNTLVVYKASGFYNQHAERAVIWNDPELGVDWGINTSGATLSAKDAVAPTLAAARAAGDLPQL